MNTCSSAAEEKVEADGSADENCDKPPADKKEEATKSDNAEPKDEEKPAMAPALEHSVLLSSTRNDLIKDIESHIEIIYECLDELNDTGSTSSTNKPLVADAVIDPPGPEAEKNDGESEKTEDVATADESVAPKESKNE